MNPSSDTLATVTVAVLTFRRPDDLDAIIPLVIDQAKTVAPLGYRARVLVVDNDPDGGARDQVRRLQEAGGGIAVVYVHEPEAGIAAARDRALLESEAEDLLVFIDDDERPSERWLRLLLDVQRSEGATAVVGPVVSSYPANPDPWILAGRFFERRRLVTGTRVEVAATNNLLLDLTQIRRFGLGFERTLGAIGRSDTVFTRKIVAHGGTMVWCDEAVVTDVVPPKRMTRRWVVQRAFSSGNGWSLTSLLLAADHGVHLPLRVRLSGSGLVRLAGGAVRVLVGTASRSLGQRARGIRTIARGAGMVSGAWGYRYQEYRRP